MTCTFTRCILVNFAVDPELLNRNLPPGLEPDIVDGRAFISIVIGQMDKMRPRGVPRPLGVTFDQIVYRAVVRHRGVRGVHFLRSDANSRLMCALGDRLSFFKFHHSPITSAERDDHLEVLVSTQDHDGDISAELDLSAATPSLPPTSRFRDMATARTHLVELFTAYALNPATRKMESVTIERDQWAVLSVPLQRGNFAYFENGPIFDTSTAQVDSVFSASNIRYVWHRLQPAATVQARATPPPGRPSLAWPRPAIA
jgi:uncharacterized protein YqjF (DUF2071 family)